MFRGREVTHPERGTALLERLASELSDVGVVEQSAIQDGRNMTMMLAPSKAVLAAEKASGDGAADTARRDGKESQAGDGKRSAGAKRAASAASSDASA